MKDLITLVPGQVGPHPFTFDVNDEDDVRLLKSDAGPNDTPIAPAGGTFSVNVSNKSITLQSDHTLSGEYILYRNTSHDTRNTFYPSGAIRADDLNKNFEQVMYAAEDKVPLVNPVMEDNLDMGGHRITNLANPFTGQGQNTVNNAIDVYDDGDAASIGFVKHFFFDSGAETILSNEDWGSGSNTKIATTQAVDYRVRSELQTALNQKINTADGITVTDGAVTPGEVNPITIGIGQGSVDLDRIKPEDIVDTSEANADNTLVNAGDASSLVDDDSKVATVGAVAHWFETFVQDTTPTHPPGSGKEFRKGQFHFAADNDNTLFIYNGSTWVPVVAGVKDFLKQKQLIWVDSESGSDKNDGHRVVDPMKTIQGAVNKAEDGDMIFVQPGVYTEYLPIDLGRKKNVSIIGLSMRSVFVHPHPTKKWNVTTAGSAEDIINQVMEAGAHGNATSGTSEYETMFQLGSGSFVANMSLAGMKASGARGDLHTDSEAAQQGWFFAFAEKDETGNAVKFQKSPYIQNVTAFADSAIDNTNYQPHITESQPGFGGDKTSAPTGGGLLVDGSVPHIDSPLRSFLTDAYTLVLLDGPGVLVKNNGYAQLVSTFGHFCHYHAKAESGGMINMSNCTTDFGRFGLVADGQGDLIFYGKTLTNGQNVTSTTVRLTDFTQWTARGIQSPKPVNHMVATIGAGSTVYLPIKSVTEISAGSYDSNTQTTNSVYDVEFYTPVTYGNAIAVNFYLRSTITTGGHVFEFAGSGTDYRALPDFGGNPVEANQVVTEGEGIVYISSSDHNGNFKVGEVFNVSTDGESVTVNGNASVSGTSTLTGAVTTGGNVTVGGTLDAQSLTINGSPVNTSGTYFDSSGNIKDTAMPDKVTAGTSAYPDSVTVDAQGRVTAISTGTEPVTSVTAAAGSAVSVTATKTPEVDVATFAGSSQKGIVVNDGTAGNDSKFLKGDGTWANPAQAAYSFAATTNTTNTDYVDLNLTGSSSSTVTLKDGQNINLTKNADGSITIAAPNSTKASVGISASPPTADITHGDMWFDQNTGESYIYYDENIAIADGTNTDAYWIQFAPQQRGTGNGTVTSVTAGTGLTGGTFTTTGTVALADTAVTIGTYGDADSVAQFTVDQQGRITGAANVDIDLDAAAVSTGIFDVARIPDLSANKITSDTLGVDRIPNLSANKITSDTLGVDRIPDLAAGKITSGTFNVDRIPTLLKSKISTTGTWNTSDIPDLSATYLTSVSADTSPSLGGSLDVAGNSIVSANNGNVTLNPDGNGVVSFANNTGTTYKNGNHGVTIKPPALAASCNIVLPGFGVIFPATDGTAGQYLKTDGSGNLSWGTDVTYTATSWRSSESTPTAGLVPASGTTAEDATKYLAGDGAWKTLPTPSTFESGMIQWWPGRTAKIPDGWVICDGSVYKYATATYDNNNQLVLPKTYNTFTTNYGTVFNLKPLRDALSNDSNESNGCIYDDQRTRVDADWKGIGTIDANNPAPTFTADEYFAVPDLRGEFIRGWDDVRGVDTNRDLGSAQDDDVQPHTHPLNFGDTYYALKGQYWGNRRFGSDDDDTDLVSTTVTGSVGNSSGTETRPRNIAMIAIIKL